MEKAKTIIIHRLGGRAYLSQQDLADKYGIDKATVRRRVKEARHDKQRI